MYYKKQGKANKSEMVEIWDGLTRCQECGFALAIGDVYDKKRGAMVSVSEEHIHSTYHGKFLKTRRQYKGLPLYYKDLMALEAERPTILSGLKDMPTPIEYTAKSEKQEYNTLLKKCNAGRGTEENKNRLKTLQLVIQARKKGELPKNYHEVYDVERELDKIFSIEFTKSICLWDFCKIHPSFEDYKKLLWNTPKFIYYISPYLTKAQLNYFVSVNVSNRKLIDSQIPEVPFFFGDVTPILDENGVEKTIGLKSDLKYLDDLEKLVEDDEDAFKITPEEEEENTLFEKIFNVTDN